ncbi:FtsX-like permease family protein [Rhodanobacter sp. DHB23]|uniref:ABC transporter permease n=1 Tax=Rhodanobacter sp. DHB23 TaxID=2775923 RepID=UPI001781CCF1|nr:FtsX-like permease family protein [Rhodanobacter sp. DHB23]MBD8872199.1 ABC transporter permease [Rhodanobacter sp. DHB23]
MTLARAFMQLPPIVTALRRHKAATLLIVLQVALTLAVTSNALFMVATRIIHLSRPTGTDESHIFVIRNGWMIGQNPTQIDANIRTDLDALRHVAGVRDAFASNDSPLAYEESVAPISTRIKLKPDQTTMSRFAMLSVADEHAIDTLGASLIAGRNFRPEEIATVDSNLKLPSPGIIITRSLADKLFPDGSALGKTVYLPNGPTVIIGILANLQGPISWSQSADGDNVLAPGRYIDPDGVDYLVRTDATDMKPAIAAALKALQERSGIRVIDPTDGAATLLQAREQTYATDRSVAVLLSIVCGMLLLATAGGIVGLSSFWVGQRRRQIGIRRSLGATKGDILYYFHTENLLIVGGGIVLGIPLAVLANLGLMKAFYPLQHMPLYVPLLGTLLLWLLGQVAVWGPAHHAAKVPPVVAIRTE